MKGLYNKIKFLAIVISLCVPMYVSAQPGFDGGGGGDTQDTVPLDGGISLLVVAGAGYGIKKIKENRKKRKEDSLSIQDATELK